MCGGQGANLSVVVLGAAHDFDEADGVHENLAQQEDVEAIHTELDAYTPYIHTYMRHFFPETRALLSYTGQIGHVLEVDAVVADHVHLVLGRIRQTQREKRVLVPAPRRAATLTWDACMMVWQETRRWL